MIEKIPFGNTNHNSTRIIFGAAAFYGENQIDADRTLDLIMEYGINHIDTAASYGNSEERLGPWLKKNKSRVFLATKTDKRTYKEAKEELFKSLDRLCVDSVDLWQMHYLVKQDEWEIAMNEGGVIEAFLEAKKEGLVKFLGVTGHDIDIAKMHKKSLDKFNFDSILLPYNYLLMQNPEYASNFNDLIKICKDKNIAVQTIKSICKGPLKESDKGQFATWYEPLTEQADIDIAVQWALSKENIFINSAADIKILPKVLDAAARFEKKISDEEMDSLVKRIGIKPLFV